jgi:3'-5' exoribonuclease
MKSPYVSELQPNQIINGTFLVQHKDIRQKKTGEPYLSLILGDRTGEVEAKMWDNAAEVMDTFERNDFLRVRGLLQVHQNRLQMTVHRLQRQPEDQVDFTDYFPASSRNVDEMFAELRSIISGIGTPCLKTLLDALMDDPEIARRYKIAPAAKNVHHAYLGGLIEHVLSMCGLARLTAGHFRDIDLDLLLAGVILHDIGKIYELTYDRAFGYSTEGQLIGHMTIGLRMIGDKIARIPDFPPRVRVLLEHMIISHHGELEFGSPKTPVFPEALLLHHIDNLDSKMECMRAFLERDRYVDGCWTGFSSSLERTVLKKRKYLDDPEPRPVEVTETVAAAADPVPPPAPPPRLAPAVPQMPAHPQQSSIFGSKLQDALTKKGG